MVRYHEIIKETAGNQDLGIPFSKTERLLAEYYEPDLGDSYDPDIDNDELESVLYNNNHRIIAPWIENVTYSIVNGKVNILTGPVSGVGDCRLKKSSTSLMINFGRCEGMFKCSKRGLTSLAGSPERVIKDGGASYDGFFECIDNQLTTLKGGPSYVEGDYDCYNNPLLESLEGLPSKIDGNLNIFNCPKLKWSVNSKIPCIVKGMIYIDCPYDLPVLKYLDTNQSLDGILIKSNIYAQITGVLSNIIEKYRNDTSMSLSEKRIRCKLELLEYPEYEGNAEW